MQELTIIVQTLHQLHVGMLKFRDAGLGWEIHPQMLDLAKMNFEEGKSVELTNRYSTTGKVCNRMLVGLNHV